MMQRHTKLAMVLALAALSPFALRAQAAAGTEYSFKLGLVNPQGDLRSLTHNSLGWGGEFDYDWLPTKETGVGVGLNAGYLVARGKRSATLNYDSKAAYAGVDLIYAITDTPLSIRSGLQLISWDITAMQDPTGSGAQGETSWKLGARFGLEYRINKAWSVSTMYDFSHWKSDTVNNMGYNPSFVTLMAGYKF